MLAASSPPGASAVAAVRAAAIVSLFDCEPGSYLAELERLAEPGS